MSKRKDDLEGQVEVAWAEFRARLADRIAALVDDEVLHVEVMTGVDDDLLEGAAPYLQFLGWGGDLVRAEVVGNAYLDERFRLAHASVAALVEAGWAAPDPEDEAGGNFWCDAETREADRVAVLAVAALRDVFGCPHPAFLESDLAPEAPAPDVASDDDADDPDDLETAEWSSVMPRDRDQLVELTHAALQSILGDRLIVEGDGDYAVRAGKESVVFVEVDHERPAVDVFAWVVVDVHDKGQLARELNVLNHADALFKFYAQDDRVVMKARVLSMPFVPALLRLTLGLMLDRVDEIGAKLAARVDAQRYLEVYDEPGAEATPVAATPRPEDDFPPALTALLEMLHDGAVAPATVAAVFDGDRLAIISTIVSIRRGLQQYDTHDPELVLDHLRAALRFVSDGEADVRREAAAPPPVTRLRSQQLTLLPDDHGQEPLDWDEDDREVS